MDIKSPNSEEKKEKQKKAVARIMKDHNIIYIGKRLTKEEENYIVSKQ